MKLRFFVLQGVAMCVLMMSASSSVSLDSCRTMALRNNKQILINKEKIKATNYQKKEALTAYLPSLDFTGGYIYNQKDISLFDSDQLLPVKTFNASTGSYEFNIAKNPITGEPIKSPNGQYIPQEVALIPKESLTYDISNLFFGAITLTQPIYMGGKISALNNIAFYYKKLVEAQQQNSIENIIYNVDVAYWQVVSLDAKMQLAQSYVTLLDTLNRNIIAMVNKGVATQNDQLSVNVKLNQAQIDLTKVKNGLTLSRMSLAQLCGLPIDSELELTDENKNLQFEPILPIRQNENMELIYNRRPDIQQLQIGAMIAHQQSKVELSSMLPNISAIGSYNFSNPNMFNGFKRNFDGAFSMGVMISIPLWNWGRNYDKYKTSQTQETIMRLNIADAKEKIALQVKQASFKVQESLKTYQMTLENLTCAKENLQHAQFGFKEGVNSIDNVMEAQTAWLKAHSEYIDAQIDIRLCNTYLEKVLGLLKY